MTATTVVNLRDFLGILPDDVVRISRPSRWGNPFYITDARPRAAVIERFRAYAKTRLAEEPDWLEPLRGKRIGCWCRPLACHGDVIVELLEGRGGVP